MVKIPSKVKKSIEKAIKEKFAFPLATSSKNGKPNVIYVRYLKLVDSETVLVADNYFDKTKKNILQNPKIAFVVLDDKAASYQVKGDAKHLTKGKYFDYVQKWCKQKHPRKAAVIIKVKEVYNGAKKLK